MKDDANNAISFATVYADCLDCIRSKTFSWFSNDDGTYVIDGLPAGHYVVRATAHNFVQRFYNGVYDRSAAHKLSRPPGTRQQESTSHCKAAGPSPVRSAIHRTIRSRARGLI